MSNPEVRWVGSISPYRAQRLLDALQRHAEQQAQASTRTRRENKKQATRCN